MEQRDISFILAIAAVLTLMGGVAVWLYSEMKSISSLEAIDVRREQWLERWMQERNLDREQRDQRVEDLNKRVSRLESLHMTGQGNGNDRTQ